MGCFGKKASDENEVELQDLKHFRKNPKGGIAPKRKCRDLLLAALFIAFWAGMLIIAAFAFSKGSPTRFVKVARAAENARSTRLVCFCP